MRGLRRRTTVLAVAACSAVLLAGCSGAASSSVVDSPGPADSTPSAPSEASDTPLTPSDTPSEQTSESITPSSDVANTVPLQTWVTAVCTAAGGFSSEAANIGKSIGSDPKNAGANLIKTFDGLGTKLSELADQLEQIGAPDVANGKKFTDQWIDASRAMAAVFHDAAASVPKNANAQQALTAYSNAFNSSKAKAATQQLEQAGKLLNTSEIEAVAKKTPECAKLNNLTGQ